MKRGTRAGVEDRWHRPARKGELVPYLADQPGPGAWCTDARHGQTGTLVTTTRHGTGKRWLARWVDHDGQERTKSFDNKAPAEQHIRSIIAALESGAYADPKRSGTAFGTVAEQWIETKTARLKPKTIAGYRSLLDIVILPRWRDAALRDINHAQLQVWITWLSMNPEARSRGSQDDGKGLSAARVIQAHQVVHQILAYAVRAKFLAANPADGIELPRKTNVEKLALTHGQVAQLAAEAAKAALNNEGKAIAALTYLLGYAGLRFGEAAALRVADVDVKAQRIRVSQSRTYVTGIGEVEGPTKTYQARSVPLAPFVMDMLKPLLSRRKGSDYLFTRANGDPINVGWYRVRFDPACAVLNLADVSPHNLRHTAGSLALASGATIATVSKMLGHRNITTTMNVYLHELPDDFDNLTAAMDTAARAAAL